MREADTGEAVRMLELFLEFFRSRGWALDTRPL